MLLTLAVVLPTPHDYSGTFQGGYSARFIASRRVRKGARRVLYPSKQPKENTVVCCVELFRYHFVVIPACNVEPLRHSHIFLINTGSQMFTSTCLFHGIKMHDHQQYSEVLNPLTYS